MVRAFLRAVVFAAAVLGVALFLLATLGFAAFLGLAAGDDALSFLTLGWVGRLPATCRPFAAALLKTLLTVFFLGRSPWFFWPLYRLFRDAYLQGVLVALSASAPQSVPVVLGLAGTDCEPL